MADINVVVTVDTENITSSNLKTTVVLTDDNGDQDKTPGDSETFDIKGETGQTVGFTIQAKNGTGTVSFQSFEYEGGTDGVMNPLPSSSNNWTGTISKSKGASEFFYINFVANGTSYKLDPQIEVDGP